MAVIPEVTVTQAGSAPPVRAAAAADTAVPSENVDLYVNNASGASINVTVVAKSPCNQGVLHDLVVAVPAGAIRLIGPLSPGRFADPVTGLASVNYSATATVTVATIRS